MWKVSCEALMGRLQTAGFKGPTPGRRKRRAPGAARAKAAAATWPLSLVNEINKCALKSQ